MVSRVKSAAAASKDALQRVPEQARQLADTMKDKAAVVGERANNALEGTTKALATAAGAVVGTVEAVMGRQQQGDEGGPSGGGNDTSGNGGDESEDDSDSGE